MNLHFELQSAILMDLYSKLGFEATIEKMCGKNFFLFHLTKNALIN